MKCQSTPENLVINSVHLSYSRTGAFEHTGAVLGHHLRGSLFCVCSLRPSEKVLNNSILTVR